MSVYGIAGEPKIKLERTRPQRTSMTSLRSSSRVTYHSLSSLFYWRGSASEFTGAALTAYEGLQTKIAQLPPEKIREIIINIDAATEREKANPTRLGQGDSAGILKAHAQAKAVYAAHLKL